MELFVTDFLASQYFWLTVAFVVILAVVQRTIVPAFLAVLDARATAIKADLDAATQQRLEAEKVLADYVAQLAQARTEAAHVVSTARAEAEALATRRLVEVEADIARKVEDARKQIAAQREEALHDLQADVSKVVMQATQKLLEATVDTKLAKDITAKTLSQTLN